jgi:hypothetical protein
LGFEENLGGGLEAVEEQAGAAGVDLAGGNAVEDLLKGLLEGGAVFEGRELEGGAADAGGGLAVLVVVVAKIFSAEGGTSATVAAGEDVAALEALDFDGLHRGVSWARLGARGWGRAV